MGHLIGSARNASRRPITRIVGALVVAGIGLTFYGLAAGAGTVPGTLALDKARYDLGETPAITLTDDDLNATPLTRDTATVNVSSTTDPNGISVNLRENAVDTGTFDEPTPAVGFVTTASDDVQNKLQVKAGDVITVTYTDISPNATVTATATMFEDKATATLNRSRYQTGGANGTATIRVADVDRNVSRSDADSFTVNLKSATSDTTGVTVTVTETGADTGLFQGTATFNTTASTIGGSSTPPSLKIQADEVITLTYAEPVFAGGSTTPRTANARMYKDDAVAAVGDADDVYALSDTATVSVTDADGNLDPSVVETLTANLKSDSDATGITITLTESQTQPGTFGAGGITFISGASSGSVLKAASGDKITLTYTEPTLAGATRSVTNTARMVSNAGATLDKAHYRTSGDNNTATLTVTDADRNLDSSTSERFNVVFHSTANPAGITVELVESSADSGVFTKTGVGFSTTTSTTALQVAAGDVVTLTYPDALTVEGTAANRTATATMYVDSATATLSKAHYQRPDTATVTVNDHDANRDRASAETVSVNLKSASDTNGIAVTLTETGADTGVFRKDATFTATPPSSAGTTALWVAAGNAVTVTYNEPLFAGGTTARTGNATMYTDDASVAVGDTDDIYASGDPATVTVTDVDRNNDAAVAETVTANLKSTSDGTGITVTLTENAANSGVFRGSATFTTGDSTATALKVASGDTVTATYQEPTFAGGSTTAKTDTARMAQTGTVALDKSRYQRSSTANLTVTDPDLNTASGTPQSTSATLKSTSDPTGISVNLTENANDSGVFAGTATFTGGASNDATDVLEVAAGDTVTLVHHETTTLDGVVTDRTATALMFVDGATSAFDRTRYQDTSTPSLTVTDPDANASATAADTVSVKLTSASDSTGITVQLTETGAATGIFRGTAEFNTTASAAGSLKVAANDAVTLTYDEASFAGGSPVVRTATANMFKDDAAADIDGDKVFSSTEPATLRVTDVDRNVDSAVAETLTVNFKSATSDTTGITVTLTETAAGSSTFVGTATFTTGTSTGSALKVSSGETVTLTYQEPTFAGQTPQARTQTARMAQTGSSSLDKRFYRLSGSDNTAKLAVNDTDLNTDSGTPQSVQVNLKSTADATGLAVTLTETGNNTGVFENNAVGFTTSPSSGTTLHAAAGDTITLTYVEVTTFDGIATPRTATATMYGDNATVAFDRSGYARDAVATVTVVDAERNVSGTARETFNVTVSSGSDATGVQVTVRETANDTGIFSGTTSFNETASAPGAGETPPSLKVVAGDTVTATYAEPKFDGGTATRAAVATVHVAGSAALNAARYDLDDTATASVTDPDLNTNSGSKQTATATLKSTSDATGVAIVLTETGNNTGVFTGTGTFTSGGSFGSTLKVAPGDTVTLVHQETTTFTNAAADRTATATVATNGSAALQQTKGDGSTVDAWRYDMNDVATLTVVDRDLNTADDAIGSVPVKLHSTADPVGITVTLNERGPNSSTFTGTATFTQGASSGSQLKVAPGDTVTLTYAETSTFEGPAANRTDTAAIFNDTGTTALNAERYGVADTATATVTDADGNLDPAVAEEVVATLTSASDTTGEELTLTETGVNTGVFTGTAGFIASPGTHAERVTIAAGDVVTLTYREPNAGGIGTTNRTDTATVNTNGTAALDKTKYQLTDTPTLTVTDTDRNTDAATVQTVPVNLKSSSDTTGVAVTLTETGPNTGTFTGTAGFVAAPSSGTNLKTASGDAITLTYAEATTFEGPAANRTAAAAMNTTSTPSFNKQHYPQGDTATLRVSDPDRNTNDATPQTVVANLKSASDTTGLSVVLTETGNNTGVFSGTATFNTTASAGTSLKVAAGDTITLTDTDATTFEGPSATRTATATMFTDGATAGLDKPRYQLTDTATATVNDPDANSSSTVKQTITANLKSASDATGVSISLNETGDDTGIFSGTATFTTGSSSGSVLKAASGDQLTLTYSESPFTGTAPSRTATAAMTTDGAVALNKVRYQQSESPVLTVTDNDLNTNLATVQTVPVNLKSDSDATGVTVTLTETGNNTGVFSGTASFTNGPSAGTALKATAGDLVTLAYAETTTFAGPAANRTTLARMATNGSTGLDKARYAANETPVLTVTDPDLNTNAGSAQTVPVNFKSTSDAAGVSVTLTETGIDTGVFTGTAAFTTAPSSGSTLKVGGGDAVTLTYAESTAAAGSAVDRTSTAVMATNGTIDLDKAQYGPTETAVVTVNDRDLNSSAATAQTVPVNLKSTADTTGVTVTLTETGNDTGIFSGTATFTTGSSSGSALKVANADTVTATYAEATTFEGPAANRTDTASIVRTLAPTTMTLTPTSGSSTTGSALDLTATVKDQDGAAFSGVPVRFAVAGANPRSGSATTNGSGVAPFSYTGTTAGSDTVTAYADTNGDSVRQTSEPQATASRTWAAPTPPPVPAGNTGYWLAGADGKVFAFGDAAHFGDISHIRLSAPIVALVGTPSHKGYWLAGSDGAVFAFGDAQGLGSMAGHPLQKPIVGMAALSNGKGYWLVATDGGIFSFGDARFHGSMGGRPLNQPMVGIAGTPTGKGYWTVAADGGIFSFGDATFQGSMGGQRLNRPVVGMTAVTRTDRPQGYRLVASDGGIFSFNAPFFGSLGSTPLNQPINGMSTVPSGEGYRMVAADGGVFSFGPAAPAKGSAAGTPKSAPVAAMDGF